MNILYVLAGIASVALSVHLLADLLKPEWFECRPPRRFCWTPPLAFSE